MEADVFHKARIKGEWSWKIVNLFPLIIPAVRRIESEELQYSRKSKHTEDLEAVIYKILKFIQIRYLIIFLIHEFPRK